MQREWGHDKCTVLLCQSLVKVTQWEPHYMEAQGWGGQQEEKSGDIYMEVPAGIIALGTLFLEALSSDPRTHSHTLPHLSVQVDNGLYEEGVLLALG